MFVDFEVRGQQGMDITGESMIFDILARSNNLKVKHLNDGFISYQHAAFHFTRH